MEENNGANTATEKKVVNFGILKFLALGLIFLVIGGGLVYAVAKKRPSLIGLPKSGVEIQKEVTALVTTVGKLISLPSDETPTVATVTDIEKIKDQVFFKNAKVGDKVLIYTNAKKAILYRPSENRIIEVGAVNINQALSSPTAKPVATSTPKPTLTSTPKPTTTPTGSPSASPLP